MSIQNVIKKVPGHACVKTPDFQGVPCLHSSRVLSRQDECNAFSKVVTIPVSWSHFTHRFWCGAPLWLQYTTLRRAHNFLESSMSIFVNYQFLFSIQHEQFLFSIPHKHTNQEKVKFLSNASCLSAWRDWPLQFGQLQGHGLLKLSTALQL